MRGVVANEGVSSDIKFTSEVTHDAFMLKPDALRRRDVIAMDRTNIDHSMFEAMTSVGIVYVTKMKMNLRTPLRVTSSIRPPTESRRSG